MVNCEHCKKALVSIGSKRANGKIGQNDWKGRKYHKTCYKLVQERIAILQKYEEYLKFD